MRSIFAWTLAGAVLLSPNAFSQSEQEPAQTKQAEVAAGTQITAALESTIDAKKAKPGDEIAARVTQDVKQDGKVVVKKGDRLLGKIVASGEGQAGSESRIAAEFDRLKSGSATTELRTVVGAVLSAGGAADAGNMMERPAGGMAAPPRPAGGGGGGLLGGAGATVGSTLGAAGGATGSVLGGVGGTLDAAADSTLGAGAGLGAATPLKAIQVESQGSASQNTGVQSVLSTKQGNLRLESGTTMQFRVAGTAASE